MKKVLFGCAAFLLLVAPASAQLCLDFNDFCDGLELAAPGGGVIEGDWVSYDCAGSRDDMNGSLSGGQAQVLCGAGGVGTCVVSPGVDWGFILDGLDGTMDMFSNFNDGSGWNIWIDELAYTNTGAPCTFLSNPNLGSSRNQGWNQ